MEIPHSIHRGSILKKMKGEPRDVLARKIVQESTEPSAFESAEKEFHSEYGNLVIKLRGKSEIKINY